MRPLENVTVSTLVLWSAIKYHNVNKQRTIQMAVKHIWHQYSAGDIKSNVLTIKILLLRFFWTKCKVSINKLIFFKSKNQILKNYDWVSHMLMAKQYKIQWKYSLILSLVKHNIDIKMYLKSDFHRYCIFSDNALLNIFAELLWSLRNHCWGSTMINNLVL